MRVRGDERGSRRVRPPAQARRLHGHGAAIVVVGLEGALFFGTADAASRENEPELPAVRRLALDETLLGQARSRHGLRGLEALRVECRFARGDAVFRQGEAGDSLYVSVQGRVAIWRCGATGGSARVALSASPGSGRSMGVSTDGRRVTLRYKTFPAPADRPEVRRAPCSGR